MTFVCAVRYAPTAQYGSPVLHFTQSPRRNTDLINGSYSIYGNCHRVRLSCNLASEECTCFSDSRSSPLLICRAKGISICGRVTSGLVIDSRWRCESDCFFTDNRFPGITWQHHGWLLDIGEPTCFLDLAWLDSRSGQNSVQCCLSNYMFLGHEVNALRERGAQLLQDIRAVNDDWTKNNVVRFLHYGKRYSPEPQVLWRKQTGHVGYLCLIRRAKLSFESSSCHWA